MDKKGLLHDSLCYTTVSMMRFIFSYIFFYFGERLQRQKAVMKGCRNKWDQDAWCGRQRIKTFKERKKWIFHENVKHFSAQSEKDNYTGCYIITVLLKEKYFSSIPFFSFSTLLFLALLFSPPIFFLPSFLHSLWSVHLPHLPSLLSLLGILKIKGNPLNIPNQCSIILLATIKIKLYINTYIFACVVYICIYF